MMSQETSAHVYTLALHMPPQHGMQVMQRERAFHGKVRNQEGGREKDSGGGGGGGDEACACRKGWFRI